uniref:Uncharacterized protein LOC100183247 n=1 Tax=Phallusia mammillata TaxID=59560 RepID=A0A6F9DHV6_9ASCI|nr:uncharacterized protein LOC100183247 [Phallusia mammillata]
MRIDKFVPENKRTGVSVYYDDYKQRSSPVCTRSQPTSVHRKNRPHPSKDFLEPRQVPDHNAELQKRVRQAVRNYLHEIYNPADNNSTTEFRQPPLFRPPSGVEDLGRTVYRPRSPTPLRQRAQYSTYYPINRTPAATPVCVTGYGYAVKPSTAVKAEVSPPAHLQGESKRDRSVRIDQEIKGRTRLTTPINQRQTWQDSKITEVKDTQKPHWVCDPQKQARKAPTKKRILSAPPGTNGYTHYPQHTKPPNMETNDMTSRLEDWAQHASNYEKQVVFNMLKQVTPRPNDTPETPDTHQFARARSVPPASYPAPHNVTQAGSNGYGTKKKRNVSSAPVKKMAGLVSSSTQHPLRDQRMYRLKGQDARIDPSPKEERNLNVYMDKMRSTSYPVSKSDKKYVIVPMHSYQARKSSGAEDYQCKVSFFQSVRSPFKSHFVIHPDFTSETVNHRKPVSHTISHFRY